MTDIRTPSRSGSLAPIRSTASTQLGDKAHDEPKLRTRSDHCWTRRDRLPEHQAGPDGNRPRISIRYVRRGSGPSRPHRSPRPPGERQVSGIHVPHAPGDPTERARHLPPMQDGPGPDESEVDVTQGSPATAPRNGIRSRPPSCQHAARSTSHTALRLWVGAHVPTYAPLRSSVRLVGEAACAAGILGP